ncbi:multidrug efflux MFS transporter [Pseudonocardia sp. MCCB 268]|nr:multidrug efflux MFS transporter [Pseudonocardia cytotoxica]
MLDDSIVNIALPSIQSALGVDAASALIVKLSSRRSVRSCYRGRIGDPWVVGAPCRSVCGCSCWARWPAGSGRAPDADRGPGGGGRGCGPGRAERASVLIATTSERKMR